MNEKRLTVKNIRKRLKEQDVFISRAAIFKLLRKYRHNGVVKDLTRARPPKKLLADQVLFIDDTLADNDELTARNLCDLLQDRWPEINMSLSTIKRTQKDLSWVSTRPRYCQMIREERAK